jgi:hypothetical protein
MDALSWISAALFCWPGAPCDRPKAEVVPTAPAVTVYHLPGTHPIAQQLTLDQVNRIGLSCKDQELITTYLQKHVGTEPRQPERLSIEEQRLNGVARTKIWQLRTYCGTPLGVTPVPVAQSGGNTQSLPARYTEQFETTTTKRTDGSIETAARSVRVEEPGLELKQVVIGEIVRPEHLRAFPVKMPKFVYNLSACTWYLDLAQYRVIACEVKPNVLQVVDKF